MTKSLKAWLDWAHARQLSLNDFKWLLAHCAEVSLSQLHVQPLIRLSACQYEQLMQACLRLAQGEPLAYVLNREAFWTFELEIDCNVLIPRPETEHLVEAILQRHAVSSKLSVLDLGTGSGAIALALASERPGWHVLASDKSEGALHAAQKNALRLALEVDFVNMHWLQSLSPKARFSIIVANPPYIAEGDAHLEQLTYEPKEALTSGDTGFEDLYSIIQSAHQHLTAGGYLFLEHGSQQAKAVQLAYKSHGYVDVQTLQDFAGHERVTFARWPYGLSHV